MLPTIFVPGKSVFYQRGDRYVFAMVTEVYQGVDERWYVRTHQEGEINGPLFLESVWAADILAEAIQKGMQ